MIANCRVCGSQEVKSIWNFGNLPLGDRFKDSREVALSCNEYPLDLGICGLCSLLQLTHHVTVNEIYDDYLYQTKITVGLDNFYEEIADLIVKLFPGKNEVFIDVGSNDGTFLNKFKSRQLNTVGIDPALRAVEVAHSKGIATIHGYFNSETLDKALKVHNKPLGMISFNYVLANIEEPIVALREASERLTDDGLISIVTGYHPKQFQNNRFDYINHDHVSYFTFRDLASMMKKLNLTIEYCKLSEMKGGSIHIIARKTSRCGNQIRSLTEVSEPTNNFTIVFDMKERIQRERDKLNLLLTSTRNVVGVGASINTTHLIHEFRIGQNLQFLVDDDSSKWGKYSPKFGLEVASFERISGTRGICIILAWQHTATLLSRLEDVGFRGEIIVPLPELLKLNL